MSFVFSLLQPETIVPDAHAFIFNKDAILVEITNGEVRIPTIAELAGAFTPKVPEVSAFGTLCGAVCYTGNAPVPEVARPLQFHSLRPLHAMMPTSLFTTAFCGVHMATWFAASKFCSRCGSAVTLSASEPAMVCTACGLHLYPKISPAVIVAVVKDTTILLGHSARFPGKRYSVIAGFVEPGETLEACVVREVKEETGIDIDTVKYFGSQPWPFPDSLMIGFTARYAGGEICVDGKEIIHAGWFSADALPDIPRGVSISSDLIDWFIAGGR